MFTLLRLAFWMQLLRLAFHGKEKSSSVFRPKNAGSSENDFPISYRISPKAVPTELQLQRVLA
jgi:hypothetical protein